MMTLSGSEKGTFASSMEALYQTFEEKQDPLLSIRAKGWDHFLELGLPTRQTEVYKKVKTRKLLNTAFEKAVPTDVTKETIAPHILPECRGRVFVFVNGHFSESLSELENLSDRVVATPLEKATRTYGAFLNNHWARTLKEETDPFAALNAALHDSGLFIYIPPKLIIEEPIQILQVVDTDESHSMLMPRLNVYLGKCAEATLVSTQAHLSGTSLFLNQVQDFLVEEGAHLTCLQDASGLKEQYYVFDAFRTTLKQNSTATVICATEGSQTTRHDYKATLTGENAEALLNGVWMLDGKNEAHMNVLIEHQAPHCHSYQLFKGALNDASRSSFEGKILIRQAAQLTDAYQLNNNLILSDNAKADSKPNLEIFADDVKASHGSTVGQLNPKHLLYLQTRGIPKEQAEALLVYGFCEEVIEKAKVSSLREKWDQKARHLLIK